MYWTKTFIPTLKEAPADAESISHKLMHRAGLIRMLISGVYSYLPLGLKVLNNIEHVIRQELDSAGAEELLLPVLQPIELWKATGRDEQLGETMIRFTDRRGRQLCLGPTHEEVITDLVKNHVQSYRQLPIILYQIQTKFRDEPRPRFGLMRSCEFVMKDAYSFDKDEAGLKESYKLMYDAYNKIFNRLGLAFVIVEADPGVMGGSVSHEFLVPAESGEDQILRCPNCNFALPVEDTKEAAKCAKCQGKLEKITAIEIGHVFQLGTKYSKTLNANYLDKDGKQRPIIMGCYGIGVSRLISAIIEQHNDENGIIWPKEVAPYEVIILPLNTSDPKTQGTSQKIYEDLKKEGVSVILDDRPERAGVKFKDADLIGIPLKVIIGEENLKKDKIELVLRKTKDNFLTDINSVLEKARQLLQAA
ncbi:MAG: proline--tRNA ligase [Candidatus Omnitrophota bacterium]